MSILFNPNGRGYNPPLYPPSSGSSVSTTAGNPGLITSTGGLVGSSGLLMTPFISPSGQSFVAIHNYNNFNCEENAEYDFPEIVPRVQGNPYQEGCVVNCHLIKLKYREIGTAQFNINVIMYIRGTQNQQDYFLTTSVPITIAKPKVNKGLGITVVRVQSFPDGKIHTRYVGLNPIISGERPRVTLTSVGGSGAYSITKLILCGNADELPQA